MRRTNLSGRTRSGEKLEDRLRRLLEAQKEIEQSFREENQRLWGVMFIDATGTAEEVWRLGPERANQVFTEYQSIVLSALDGYSPTYVDAAGGPQLIACFETPHDALESAHAVLCALKPWNPSQAASIRLMPSIGIHLGYLVYKDGKLLQSNTTNIAKRIQTVAQPGQVLVSEEVYETLQDSYVYSFSTIGTFNLKNIPEPQVLYEATMESNVGLIASASKNSPTAQTNVAATSDALSQHSHIWGMVYIDVCESTKKFWSYGDLQASRLIEEYQKLCFTTFSKHLCAYQLSCEGDQIFAGFEVSNIDGAIASSIQIMQTLFRRNMNVANSQKVQAAIGIHFGKVIFQDNEMMQSRDTRIGKLVQTLASSNEILLTADMLNMTHADFRQFIEKYDTCTFPGLPNQYDVFELKWTRLQLNTTYLRKILGTFRPSVYRKF